MAGCTKVDVMCGPIGKIAEVTQRWKMTYAKNGFEIDEKEANALAKGVDKRFLVKVFRISGKNVVTGNYKKIVKSEFKDLFKKMGKELKEYEYCGTYRFTPTIYHEKGDYADMDSYIGFTALRNPSNLCIGWTFRPKKQLEGLSAGGYSVIVALAKKDLFDEIKYSSHNLRNFSYFISENELKMAKKKREQMIPKLEGGLNQISRFMDEVRKPGLLELSPSKITRILGSSDSMGLVRLDRDAKKYKRWMSRWRKAVVLIEGGTGFSVKEGRLFVKEELPNFEKIVCQMRQKSTKRRYFEAQVLLLNERG